MVERALSELGPTGDVLELAGGSGWWTERLAATADTLTVVDASPEVLALNRDRVQRDDVRYVIADLFDWTPERRYDVVFFSFWLSHVPRPRVPRFWKTVRSCLADDGRVFLIDSRTDPIGPATRDPHVVQYGPDIHLRELGDGSEHRVVKVMYEPDELESLLRDEGWNARIQATRWFIFGTAAPA